MPSKIFEVMINYYTRYRVKVEGDKTVSIESFHYPGPYVEQAEACIGDITLHVGAPWQHLTSQQETGPAAKLLCEMRNPTI